MRCLHFTWSFWHLKDITERFYQFLGTFPTSRQASRQLTAGQNNNKLCKLTIQTKKLKDLDNEITNVAMSNAAAHSWPEVAAMQALSRRTGQPTFTAADSPREIRIWHPRYANSHLLSQNTQLNPNDLSLQEAYSLFMLENFVPLLHYYILYK